MRWQPISQSIDTDLDGVILIKGDTEQSNWMEKITGLDELDDNQKRKCKNTLQQSRLRILHEIQKYYWVATSELHKYLFRVKVVNVTKEIKYIIL